MSNRALFEAYWQADIAYNAMLVALPAFDQSGIDDDELTDLIQMVKDDLEVVINSIKDYAQTDLENGKSLGIKTE